MRSSITFPERSTVVADPCHRFCLRISNQQTQQRRVSTCFRDANHDFRRVAEEEQRRVQGAREVLHDDVEGPSFSPPSLPIPSLTPRFDWFDPTGWTITSRSIATNQTKRGRRWMMRHDPHVRTRSKNGLQCAGGGIGWACGGLACVWLNTCLWRREGHDLLQARYQRSQITIGSETQSYPRDRPSN